jgi:hypothetical protein
MHDSGIPDWRRLHPITDRSFSPQAQQIARAGLQNVIIGGGVTFVPSSSSDMKPADWGQGETAALRVKFEQHVTHVERVR